MVDYSCNICSKVFKQKGHMELHKNRKLSCKKDDNTIEDTNAMSSEMDYTKKSREELIVICKEKKIKGYSGKKKDNIIILLIQK